MKSSVKPQVQFFSSALSKHVSKLLEEGIEVLHLGMDLADLPQCHAFFVREIAGASQHQSYGLAWYQFDGRCRFTDLDSLLLHWACLNLKEEQKTTFVS